ncbi:MAG: hypothetical protein JSW11_17490 [Candidatus Heimdallarchaeota archaeon]|nr:MAG: hypothetical protein JSW11_17490 [Candidatus Heimdallarchaeota archaeon]
MHTDDIIKVALDLVGMSELPVDSAVYVHGENINNILYGIDIGVAELLYAKEQGFDCVIAHHPVGLVNHFQVFQRHLDQLISKGVTIETAQKVIDKKMMGFKFGSHARNYDAIPSFARLIRMPFLNIHCPSDELGRRLITESIEKLEEQDENPLLHEVRTHLETSFLEFREAKTKIEVAKGNESDSLGNWIFSHGAFTNGGFPIADCYYQYDVDTVIYIHIAPVELSQILNLNYGQLLITGHLASDSIGINPFLDRLEERGIQITAIGGLIR